MPDWRKKFNEAFDQYVLMVYPVGICEEQRHQLKAVFFAGAISTFTAITTASVAAKTEDDGAVQMEAIHNAIQAECQAVIHHNKRN